MALPTTPIPNSSGPPNLLNTTIENVNQNQTGATTQGTLGNSSSMGVFTPQQLALQGGASNLMGQILSGQTPQWFGLPQSTYDAAFYNFNKYQAPQLAAQYGTGSPAIGSAMQELQLQLAGMGGMYNTQNALNAFNSAAQWAFHPVGQNETGNNYTSKADTSNLTRNTMQNDINAGGILGMIGMNFF